MDAGIAASDAFPACKDFFNDETEGQRGDAQVNALDAQRRQADHQAHGSRQAGRAGQGNRKGYAGIGHDRLGVRAHPQKGSMAQGEQASEAGQQHQPKPRNRVDQDKGQLRQPVLGKQPGCRYQQQHQRAVPEHMAGVLGKIDVLPVVGFEDKSHEFLFF